MLFYTKRDYIVHKQNGGLLHLQRFQTQEKEWSKRKALKEWNKRVNVLKDLPQKLRKSKRVTKEQKRYSNLKNILLSCSEKTPCLSLACTKCLYYNNIVLVDEVLHQFRDSKKLYFFTLLSPGGEICEDKLHDYHSCDLYDEFMRAAKPVIKYIKKGILSAETKWCLKRKRWIMHVHIICSLYNVKAFHECLKAYYCGDRACQIKPESLRDKHDRVRMCGYIMKMTTYTSSGLGKQKKRPVHHIERKHLMWLHEKRLDMLLVSFGFKFKNSMRQFDAKT